MSFSLPSIALTVTVILCYAEQTNLNKSFYLQGISVIFNVALALLKVSLHRHDYSETHTHTHRWKHVASHNSAIYRKSIWTIWIDFSITDSHIGHAVKTQKSHVITPCICALCVPTILFLRHQKMILSKQTLREHLNSFGSQFPRGTVQKKMLRNWWSWPAAWRWV